VSEIAVPVLIPEAFTVLSIGALAVGLAALALGIAALRRAGRMAAHYQALMRGVDGADLAVALDTFVARLDAAGRRIDRLEADTAGLDGYAARTGSAETSISGLGARVGDIDGRLRRAVQHVHLLRYSAFEDVGGDQSFALAMLDDHGDGVVLSGLHHRNGVRIYAKPLADRRSTYALTSEEERAIAAVPPTVRAG